MGNPAIETRIGPARKKFVKTRGGNFKIKMYAGETINVSIPEENSTKSAKIKGLEENASSKDYQRRNILTKGAIIDTDMGLVRITSRPGQHGVLNGVLLEE